MGGRKTEAITLQKKAPPHWTLNSNMNPWSARNLAKKDLAGVIFGCKHSTYKECIFKQLFGLPEAHFQYVKNVTQGMPVFLFNYSDRMLHGIFEAISAGQLGINPYAWMSEGEEKSPFPAQVRVKIQRQCQPLTEDQYQPILAENYSKHEPKHFWFELDKSQTVQLISLFSASPVTERVLSRLPAEKWGNLFSQSIAAVGHQSRSLRITTSDRASGTFTENDEGKRRLEVAEYVDAPEKRNNPTSFQGKSWSSLFKSETDSISNNEVKSSKKPAWNVHIPSHNQDNVPLEFSCFGILPDGENEPFEQLATKEMSDELDNQVSNWMPNPQLYEDDEQLTCSIPNTEFADVPDAVDVNTSLTQKSGKINIAAGVFDGEKDTTTAVLDDFSSDSNMEWTSSLPNLDFLIELDETPLGSTIGEVGHVTRNPCSERSLSSLSGTLDLEGNTRDTDVADDANTRVTCLVEEMISEIYSSDLLTVLTKLIQTVGDMKLFQLTQDQKIQTLEQELVQSHRKIKELEYNCGTFFQTNSSPSGQHVKERQLQSYSLDSNCSILLVGGFDGSSWLSNLDSYSPSKDMMQSLKPMTSVRSYSSAVVLNGGLCVMGGGYGTAWYNTVESYGLESHKWVSFPPLNRKKGSLAGACLNDKMFAIGGGNTSECFSEVEMLDMNIGKWIFTRSMTQKRFAPAAAQMNGVLYAVGGFDGQEYLKSVERFDPREYAWTTLASMNMRRGCHSVTVLNEKLYAIGGYDGFQMSPTVEVFEPRVGSWIMSEPMKYPRGYMGAVTLGNTVLAMGGMRENEEILDTVELYSEGGGWQLTDLKSVGKRCFFSAVVA